MKKKKYHSNEWAAAYAEFVMKRIDLAMKNVNDRYLTDTDVYIDLINAEMEISDKINENGYIAGNMTKGHMNPFTDDTPIYKDRYGMYEQMVIDHMDEWYSDNNEYRKDIELWLLKTEHKY